MTDHDDDEEKQLRLELLALDVSLRRKQEFWTTPRNIALLVGVAAAIAAAIGYWLGRMSMLPPPTATPVFSSFDATMTRGEFIDGVQTAGIFIIAALMIYVVVRLDRTVTAASKRLKTMIVKQQGLEEGIERVWKRVELLESLQSQKTFVPTAESMAMLKEIRRRIDTLEANHEGPPDNHDQPRS
jgi:hypothetical protein